MTSRPYRRSAAAALATACAAAVLSLAAAVLSLAAAVSPAVASEAGGAPGAADTTRPGDAVTLTPASGTSGTTVSVRADCATAPQDGAVSSPAFAQPAVLRPAPDGTMVAEATVRHGLAPGHGYVVTANCSAAESLTTTFVTTGAADGAVGAQRAGARTEPAGSPVDGVALAFGGGLAGAALAGYVLTARRFAARRRLGVSSISGRR